MIVTKEVVDKHIETTFTRLIQYLSTWQDAPAEYDELHKLLLEWIKKHK